VLDALTLERRGIPAAVVGVEKLVETTGRGMCRAQGVPDFPIAKFSYHTGSLASLNEEDAFGKHVAAIVEQVEDILLRGRLASRG
jgi:hypothetical protein